MLDPFDYWSRVMTGWRTIGDTAARMERTATASRAVITSRSETISDAIISPLTADTAELARMVPEKLTAFSLASAAITSAWWRMQADYIAEAQHVAKIMLRARPITLAEIAELSSRSAALGLRTFEASSRLGRDALSPIHKSASGNARRLRNRASRSRAA